MKYKKILEPLKIRSLELSNRMVVSAMVTNFANEDGSPTEKYISYLEEKAKGGWGVIITENYTVVKDGGGFKALPSLYKDELIAEHKKLTDRIHAINGKIIAQIYHAGRETLSSVVGHQIVGPSAIREPSMPEIPRELKISEIEDLVQKFADCAERVKKAGFDGVEIHGAHGYLVGAFVSPFSNKRTDEYGGSITRRAKFACDIVREVRKRVGQDFPIFYRMSTVEYVDGGLEIEEAKVLARLLQEAGVDCLHCSQGVYSSPKIIIPPAKVKKGIFVDNAAQIKSVVDIPVIAVGRITDPEIADSILVSGKADLVTMARASLADPFLPKKVMESRDGEINRCIGCRQGCSARSSAGLPILCMVNPRTGMENVYRDGKAECIKRVLIVGGGISGTTAAIAAAQHGHQVILCEKTDRLGGQWILASIPPGKTDFGSFLVWQSEELKRLGVEVKLLTTVDETMIEYFEPDVIIDATGSVPFVPPIEGITGTNVAFASDILLGKRNPGKNVVVIGGGMVGIETAEFVAQGGSHVSILEMLPEIGRDAESETRMMVLESLEKFHVDILTSSRVISIQENTVISECCGEKIVLDKIDSVILAAGMKSNTEFSTKMSKHFSIVIGDASKVKNGLQNIQEAYKIGWSI